VFRTLLVLLPAKLEAARGTWSRPTIEKAGNPLITGFPAFLVSIFGFQIIYHN